MSLYTMAIGSGTHNEGAFSFSLRPIQLRCLLKELESIPTSGGSADRSFSTACLKSAALLRKLSSSCPESSLSLEEPLNATYRDSASPRAIASPDALIAKTYIWAWYVIVGRSIRFERLVNAGFSSGDDEPQELVLFDPLVACPKIISRCSEQAIDYRQNFGELFRSLLSRCSPRCMAVSRDEGCLSNGLRADRSGWET